MKKDWIFHPQGSLFGQKPIIGFGNDAFCVKEVSRDVANAIIIANHYSGKIYAASYIHLGVYIEGVMVGVLQFGYAMNPASMASVVKDTKIDEYLELNRMWFKDGSGKDSKSQAMSYAMKYLRRKYPKIKWVQSFADERCNKYGIVYQACNFAYCGEHTSTFWELDGIWYHNSLMTRNPKLSNSAALLQANKERALPHDLRQFRYLYFIKRNAIKDLLLPIKQPPKHYEVTA
jgi:adenine modification enzyme